MSGGKKKLNGVWGKAYLAVPQDTLIGQFSRTPPFIPSYENDCTVNLNYLLCYEYYRIWRREIDELLTKRKSANKTKKLKKPTFDKPKSKKKTNNKDVKKKEKPKVQKEKKNEPPPIPRLAGEPPAVQFETCICDQYQ